MSRILLSGLAGFGVGQSETGAVTTGVPPVAVIGGVVEDAVVAAAPAVSAAPVTPTTTAGRVRTTEPKLSARAPALGPVGPGSWGPVRCGAVAGSSLRTRLGIGS